MAGRKNEGGTVGRPAVSGTNFNRKETAEIRGHALDLAIQLKTIKSGGLDIIATAKDFEKYICGN